MNKQLKGSIFRMYPNIEQQILIEKSFGASRYTHNYFLDKSMKCKNRNVYNDIKELPNLTKEYPSLETEKIKPTLTLFITVQNISELYELLQRKVEVVKPLHQTFYGKDEFTIFDNHRNILTISSWKIE